MKSKKSEYKHIEIKDGTAYIIGTNTKVIELAVEYYAYGWSPEEFKRQHPFLTLSQIYSAFSYYWDNNKILDKEIEKRYNDVKETMRNKNYHIKKSKLLSRLKFEGVD
jgi:uncharacterized protein (DUF433 family)